MNKIILYVVVLLILFSILHYMAFTSIPLVQLNLTVPVENYNKRNIIVNPGTQPERNVELHLNNTNTLAPLSTSKSKDNNVEKDNWLHRILGALLGILSAISMFIKFLIDLTIIRIPQPTINETHVNGSSVIINPLYTIAVLLASMFSAIILLLYLSHNRVTMRKRTTSPLVKHEIGLGLASSGEKPDFSNVKTAIVTSFQHIYQLAREKLGLDDARTPREIALEYEKIDLGDEAWLIVSAFEELKYGNRIPGWITLKDLREAVSIIDGKIMKWSNQ